MAEENKLRPWRLAFNMTLEELAARVGTDKTQLSRLEKGKRRLTVDWMERIAKVYGCRREDLFYDPPVTGSQTEGGRRSLLPARKRAPHDALEFAGESYTAVPVFDVKVAAGSGKLPGAETITHRLLFRAAWLGTVTQAPLDQLAIVEVDGDSMEPTLRPGDTALIDRSQIKPGGKDGLYVLRRDGNLQVKRLAVSFKSRRATIMSDNPIYPTENDVDPATIDIIGRVIWIGRRI